MGIMVRSKQGFRTRDQKLIFPLRPSSQKKYWYVAAVCVLGGLLRLIASQLKEFNPILSHLSLHVEVSVSKRKFSFFCLYLRVYLFLEDWSSVKFKEMTHWPRVEAARMR